MTASERIQCLLDWITDFLDMHSSCPLQAPICFAYKALRDVEAQSAIDKNKTKEQTFLILDNKFRSLASYGVYS